MNIAVVFSLLYPTPYMGQSMAIKRAGLRETADQDREGKRSVKGSLLIK